MELANVDVHGFTDPVRKVQMFPEFLSTLTVLGAVTFQIRMVLG